MQQQVMPPACGAERQLGVTTGSSPIAVQQLGADDRRMIRRWRERLAAPNHRAALAYAAIGAWLVPWSAVLTATTPANATARHWNLAWGGLDLGEATAAAATAWLLAHRDRRAAQSAAALATLLCVDAWFDVVTAPAGRSFSVALAEALCLELPLAAASAWLSARLATEWAPVELGH